MEAFGSAGHRGRGSLLVVILVGLVLMDGVGGLTNDEKDQINAGLQAGEAIANFITSKEFSKCLTKVASSASMYLGVLGPFIGVVLAFIPSESAEMAFMKEMMKNIDNRFDQMDSRFNDIERLIDWNAVKVNFGQIEQKILAMGQEYEFIYQVPKNAVENRKTIFLSHYDSDYQNSGTKLYQAVTQGQGVFQENIQQSVMRYTKYDRKKTQVFLLGIMQLLLQAVKIELTNLEARKFADNAKFMKNVWQDRIQEVRQQFEATDRIVRDRYHSQSLSDLIEFAEKNTKLSSKSFTSGLFNLLAGKYYWRDWIVLAYNEIGGWDKHTLSTCGGHIRLRKNSRNLLVGSVDRSRRPMDLARAERDMKRVAVTERKGNWFTGYYTRKRDARQVYDSLNKNGACEVSVIKCYEGLHYHYHSRRFKYVSRCPYFNLNMWG